MDSNTRLPFIPETITVHLGTPSESADNITLPFVEYIANVASSEIFPTWPDSAIRANMYAQISFALNRIYTEYYRSRGYDFDITNSTANDQSFVAGREYFENIGELAYELLGNYLVREGSVEPLFAAYCDGVELQCDGLSQWGTVILANQGLTPFEILQYYYGDDISIVRNAPIMSISSSAPTVPLRLGSGGDEVRSIQLRLNRISQNYPSIPKIVIPDGVFSYDTEDAVRRFQEVFSLTPDGIVGRATWYKIQTIYNAVKRLSELDSEGVTLSEVTAQFERELGLGDRGTDVANIQYLLSYLGQFYDTLPRIDIDGIYGNGTADAVRAFERTFELPITGNVDLSVWDVLYRTYIGYVEAIPLKYTEGVTIPYPGVPLRLGSESDAVRVLQEYISYISGFYGEIPSLPVTGYFGPQTESAVNKIQSLLGIEQSGTVASVTWNAIAELYSALYAGTVLGEGQYPGYAIG